MIQLFSHDDLDGVGCAILAKIAFKDNVHIELCDHSRINDAVKEHFNKNTEDICHITDICVSDELAEMIDKSGRIYQIFDHHPTALDFIKYDWCTIKIKNIDGITTSGTEIYYNWLLENGYLNKSDVLDRFVQIVRDYDTWRWTELGENGVVCKQVNDLLYIYRDVYGDSAFISWAIHCIEYGDFPHFYDGEKLMLKMKQSEINAYIEEKNKQMVQRNVLGRKCGVVFADKYFSELGNKLAAMHKEVDFVAIIDAGNKTVSYRSVKEDVHLGNDIAKYFGGGGHAKAAGSGFSELIQKKIIDNVF